MSHLFLQYQFTLATPSKRNIKNRQRVYFDELFTVSSLFVFFTRVHNGLTRSKIASVVNRFMSHSDLDQRNSRERFINPLCKAGVLGGDDYGSGEQRQHQTN